MTLWIVEDDDMHLSKILEAIEKEKDFSKAKIYVNRDIVWPLDKTLPTLKPRPGVREPRSPEYLPDIVVLDLLFETKAPKGDAGEFAGGAFYDRLRQEEGDAHKRRSQVIVYSQFRGLLCTQEFVAECLGDNHFVDVVKSPGLLMEELGRARQKVVDGE